MKMMYCVLIIVSIVTVVLTSVIGWNIGCIGMYVELLISLMLKKGNKHYWIILCVAIKWKINAMHIIL